MTDKQAADGLDQASNQPQFALQRIYVKDISFESPRAPGVFQEQWAPQVKLDLNTANQKLQENIFEVVLSLTITVSSQDQTAFLVEVQQAGIFTIAGIEDERLEQTLGAFCPNLLFPYARETVDSLVTRGSFPALHLAPINFDALFVEARKRRAGQAATSAASETTH